MMGFVKMNSLIFVKHSNSAVMRAQEKTIKELAILHLEWDLINM